MDLPERAQGVFRRVRQIFCALYQSEPEMTLQFQGEKGYPARQQRGGVHSAPDPDKQSGGFPADGGEAGGVWIQRSEP